MSLQFILGLPGLLLKPVTSHCSAYFGMRTSSILVTWPSHRNLLSQITFSRSACPCPVLFRISSSVTLSLQVIPRKIQDTRHLLEQWPGLEPDAFITDIFSGFMLNVNKRDSDL